MISAVPVDFPDSALEAEVLDDLGRVEESLAATAHPDDESPTEASRFSIAARRQALPGDLVLLAARFGDPKDPRVIDAAVAIELTHLATLFHDDVMDEALVRGGQPSANSRWNNSVAILPGTSCSPRPPRSWPARARTRSGSRPRRSAGWLPADGRDHRPRPGQDPLDFYMYVITEKTGSLIAASGRFGALFSGAPVEVADQIAAACEQIGVAWQLSDDVIDIASDSSQSGKTPGTDLRQGVRTLPVLYALRAIEQSGPRSPRPLGLPLRLRRMCGCAGCWRRPT